jgi:cytosine/uracil/thiamine/allantoin permease
MACKLIRAIAIKWYKILSYIGSDAIKQLPKYINGVKLTEFINK